MVRLAFLLTGSTEVAHDVAQDAFVELHRRWESVGNPGAYLRRSVLNGCHSHHRRESVILRFQTRLRPADQSVELGARELLDALSSLPSRQRAAVVLRFYEGMNEAEIADVLGCRPGTVGSLISRALHTLRKVIR